MKPSQSPSVRQILIYDISSQRYGIYSLFLGIPSLGLLVYGLLSNSFEYAAIGLGVLLVSFWEIARLILRFRFFQKIYESGETTKVTLDDVFTNGDEINVNGQYIYKSKAYYFSTTLQKTGRTKNLVSGDQIWLVIDQDHPENTYVQDLFTPDSPEEIRQPHIPDTHKKRQIPTPENGMGENGTYRIKVSAKAAEKRNLFQPSAPTGGITEPQSRKLTVRDFPSGFLVIGIILLSAGVLLYVFMSDNREGAIFAGALGLLVILLSLISILTITIDKDAGVMNIKSIWRRNAIEIPLNELLDIQVEASESDDGDTYRLIAVKTDGTIIPFRSSYTSGFSSYEKRATQLCNFIGTSNQ